MLIEWAFCCGPLGMFSSMLLKTGWGTERENQALTEICILNRLDGVATRAQE